MLGNWSEYGWALGFQSATAESDRVECIGPGCKGASCRGLGHRAAGCRLEFRI